MTQTNHGSTRPGRSIVSMQRKHVHMTQRPVRRVHDGARLDDGGFATLGGAMS
jgi:hypothetical protein